MRLFLSCIQLLVAELSNLIKNWNGDFANTNIIPQNLAKIFGAVDWKSKIEEIISVLTTGVGNVMLTAINMVSSIFSVMITAVLSIIFAIYLLNGKEKLGSLIGFTALIPVAGAYIGAGVGAFMIMTVSPIQAIIFLIYIVVLQQLEGNIIYPRVVGSSMGLPGIWMLVAVTVGGGVMGVPGMVLSVPLFATVYRLIRDEINKGNEKNQC